MEGPEAFSATRGTGPWLNGVKQAASTTWLGLYFRMSDPSNQASCLLCTPAPRRPCYITWWFHQRSRSPRQMTLCNGSEACFFHKAAFLRQWPFDRDPTRCGGVGRRLCERGLGRGGMGAMGGYGNGTGLPGLDVRQRPRLLAGLAILTSSFATSEGGTAPGTG
jgi:hypothetical protein